MSQWRIPPDLHSHISGGPVCFHKDHSIGCLDGRIPRYTDSHACIKCVSALTEGRFSLDVHQIHKKHRKTFLQFWTMVDIQGPDDCWEWHGKQTRSGQPIFDISRHWTSGRGFSCQRSAVWFTHGDVGRLPIKAMCGNPSCCNPLHLRVKGVNHFFHRRHLKTIDLEFNSRKLIGETTLFLQTVRDRDPIQFKKIQQQNQLWIEARIAAGGPLDPLEMARKIAENIASGSE